MRKKLIVLTLITVIAGSIIVGCGDKGSSGKGNTPKTTEESTESKNNSGDEKKNDEAMFKELIGQENKIMGKNDKIWGKIFGKVDKDKAAKEMENGKKYYDFLKDAVENAKDVLSDDEMEIIKKDLKEIKKIELKIMELNVEGVQ